MGTKVTLRRGQAFMELAIGMLALSLVLAAMFSFIGYIIESLDIQRDLRARVGVAALTAFGLGESYESAVETRTISLEPLAAEYIFGSEEIELQEAVYLPSMGGLNL